MYRRVRVLVVDDDPMVRRALQRWLDASGFDVLEAGAVEAARALVATEVVDVALVDIRLGGEDRARLARDLRSRGLTTISMSGVTPHPLPPLPFLRKPIDGDALVLLIEELTTHDALQRKEAPRPDPPRS
mgnify:CR=1 FL=1